MTGGSSDAAREGPPGLRRLNGLPEPDAVNELLMCCGARSWATAVAAARPFEDAAALARAADAAFAGLDWPGVTEALGRHPRIGDRPAGAGVEAVWSRGEQSGVDGSGRETAEELRAGNVAYERRFGHVFLICATGLPADLVLSALRKRLGNDPEAERAVVRTELAKIAHLRLGRLAEAP